MAATSTDEKLQSSPSALPGTLSKARPFESVRKCSTEEGRRRYVLESHADKQKTNFTSFPGVLTTLMHTFMASFLEGKAQERESEMDSDDETVDVDEDMEVQCFFQSLQTTTEINFNVKNFKMIHSIFLEDRSFILDTMMLYILDSQTEALEREERFVELKSAVATAQTVIGDFRHKLIQIQEIDEDTEKDIAILKSFLASALENVELLKTQAKLDDNLISTYYSEGRRVCHALGLELDFLDRFDYENFPENIRDHLSIEQWICNFLREDYKMQTELCEFGSLQNKEVLERIGFRADGDAVNTLLRRASTLKEHLHILDWAEMYVKDQFKYNPVLSGFYPRFPFEHDILEQWLRELILAVKQGDNQSYREVNIINLESKESASYTKQDNCSYFPQGLEDETHKVLFHGTDHDSALSILCQGVRITQGRKNRDFSSGSGFYLTDNLEHSVDWAFSSTCKPAVLVYRVDRSLLETFSGYSLCGEERKEKWKDLVRQYRSGKPPKKLRKSLRAYDYIEGPRASSCDPVSPEPKDGTYQMCVISDELAEALKSCLHSALFFDKLNECR